MPYAGMPPDLILRAPCPPDVCPAPAPQPGDGCRRSCSLPGPVAGCSGAGPARDRRQGPAPSQSPGSIAKPAVSPASLAAKKVRFVQPSNQSAGRSISGASAGHNQTHSNESRTFVQKSSCRTERFDWRIRPITSKKNASHAYAAASNFMDPTKTVLLF